MKNKEIQLKKFKNEEIEKKKKTYISLAICLFFLIAGIVVYRTFAVFEKNIEKQIVNASTQKQSGYDVRVILTVDKEYVEKTLQELIDGGYSIASSSCTNEATISYVSTSKTFAIANLTKSGTICQVDFKLNS